MYFLNTINSFFCALQDDPVKKLIFLLLLSQQWRLVEQVEKGEMTVFYRRKIGVKNEHYEMNFSSGKLKKISKMGLWSQKILKVHTIIILYRKKCCAPRKPCFCDHEVDQLFFFIFKLNFG